MQSFKLWSLHHKIQFSANDYFNVDCTILYSVNIFMINYINFVVLTNYCKFILLFSFYQIIGAIGNYLLVLIQFKQQEEDFNQDI